MQGEDGLHEGGDAGGGASQLAQKPPVLEGGHGLLDECANLRVGAVEGKDRRRLRLKQVLNPTLAVAELGEQRVNTVANGKNIHPYGINLIAPYGSLSHLRG